MLEARLLACRYASADALEKLGVVYREATGLLQEYYGCFVDETRLAGKGTAMIEGETGVAALEKDMLQKKIARPLSECCLLRLALPESAPPCLITSSLASNYPCMPYVQILQAEMGCRCVVCIEPANLVYGLKVFSLAAGELQTSLQRETVLWTRGLLVAPPIVYDLLNAMMVRHLTPCALCGNAAGAMLG